MDSGSIFSSNIPSVVLTLKTMNTKLNIKVFPRTAGCAGSLSPSVCSRDRRDQRPGKTELTALLNHVAPSPPDPAAGADPQTSALTSAVPGVGDQVCLLAQGPKGVRNPHTREITCGLS